MTANWSIYRIGDCERLLPIEELRIDAIVTDPPFRLSFSDNITNLRKPLYAMLKNTIGSSPDFDIKRFLPHFDRICHPMILFLFCSKHELLDLISWAESNQYIWELLTWHKKNPIPFTNNHFLSDTEFIFYAREKGAYFPTGRSQNWELLKTYYLMDSPRRKVGRGERAGKCLEHPCTKPLKIIENLVRIASPCGATILDPFAGSGTTARAALKYQRNAVLYEINPTWEPLLKEACNGSQSTLMSIGDSYVAEYAGR